MQNFGNVFQDENISFTYSKQWIEENTESIGKSCMKKLVFIENKLQNILIVNKYINKNKGSMEDYLDKTVDSFIKQGWDVVDSKITSISGADSILINTKAKDNTGREFNQYVIFVFYNGFMYVFELTTFPDSKNTIKEFQNIINSIIVS